MERTPPSHPHAAGGAAARPMSFVIGAAQRAPFPVAITNGSAHHTRSMSTPSEVNAANQTVSPLEAFSGGIARTKTGLLYKAALAIVAFAMVLLPLIYLALIALTVWAVLFHLKNNT